VLNLLRPSPKTLSARKKSSVKRHHAGVSRGLPKEQRDNRSEPIRAAKVGRAATIRAATINRAATIRAAKINRAAAMTAVIISAVVAVIGSALTAYAALSVATRQIESADARSKSEFLTKQRMDAYSAFIGSVDAVLYKAPVVAALSAAGPTDLQSISRTPAWAELDAAFQKLGETSVKVNLTGSEAVSAIADHIAQATNAVYFAVTSGQALDRGLVNRILELKLDFSRVARTDLTGQR
jgi:hypothetical protein